MFAWSLESIRATPFMLISCPLQDFGDGPNGDPALAQALPRCREPLLDFRALK